MAIAFSVPAIGEAYEWPLSPTIERRFRDKVSEGCDGDCSLWLAFRNDSGYGMIRNGQRMALAHRVAWALSRGRIPAGLHVLHTCDNPACVNVAHLYLGTNAQNVADKVDRGRSHVPQPKKRGERHPLAKLSEADVRTIRREHVGRRGQGKELAARYGVSRATITLIVKRRIWAHV